MTPNPWYAAGKAVAEFAAALLLLLLALPLIVAAAVLVKLTSRGPAFYTQTRMGRRGRPFTIYKLRTMIHNCESLTGPRWAMPDDPRVTWVGSFLRKAHLDELPQLLNVLRGDMSLIGPRPERPELIPELEQELPRYRERLAVRPGLTGLAQIQLPPDTDLGSVRRKLACDLFYVEHFGPRLDLGLLVCTVLYVLRLPTRMVQGWLGVPTYVAVEQAFTLPHAEETSRLRRSA
jgi:lipopolysaccharide/colanic/teichoic acid biosynthesis glycosyltransferase